MLVTLEENGINVPVASSADGDKFLGVQGIPGVDGRNGLDNPGLVRGTSLKWRNGYRGNDAEHGDVS